MQGFSTNSSPDSFIQIPDGEAIAAAMTTTVAAAVSRFCGRYLNPTTAQDTSIAVCSKFILYLRAHKFIPFPF